MTTVSPARALRLTVMFGALAFTLPYTTGCGHKKNAKLPPQQLPPAAQPENPPPPAQAGIPAKPSPIPITPVPPGGLSDDDLDYVSHHKPIATQTGYATWYTAPYKGRKSANGQIFDDTAMTAAHRTLPMGSLIVVTNLQTGQSAPMRVSDRGPFVEGRVIDLTAAAAKATGVYRAGLAQVRIDVYQTPKPIKTGGRWCVQIGAFHDEDEALHLKAQLQRQYSDANVIEFPGEKSFWVRIRPQGDDRAMAEQIARKLRPKEGEAYLTRLD
jgi:rare lipoprotein A